MNRKLLLSTAGKQERKGSCHSLFVLVPLFQPVTFGGERRALSSQLDEAVGRARKHFPGTGVANLRAR